MKIAFLGVDHWHSNKYISLVKDLDLEIVGIHTGDKELLIEKQKKWEVRCGDTDAAKLLDDTKPDFAISFGTHREMPELISLLIDRRIPFMTEKPAGITSAVVTELAKRCAETKLFNAVAFAYRWDPGIIDIKNLLKSGKLGRIARIGIQFFAGPASRYRQYGCPWVLEKKHAGGGCFMNIGVHLLDTISFFGFEPEYLAGTSSREINRADIEDVSSLLLRMGKSYAVIECGYCAVQADKAYTISINAEKGSLDYHLKGNLKVSGDRNEIEIREYRPLHFSGYPAMVKEMLEKCIQGEPSPVDLFDMAKALRILDAFYERI